jgi:long-chain alkane monooxygenase
MTSDPFVLSAFTMSTVSHGNFGLWRHPEDQTSNYTDIRYWVELAKLLDSGGFDVLFIADAVGQLDVFGGDATAALTRAIQTPVTDPLLAVSAMAAATERLCFGITVSTTYEAPYLLARKFSTLDHLTGGRIGWNIVTSLLDSAARNIIGRERQIPHDERYAIAQEFVEVTYKLWEGSWESDAVLRDRISGVYTDAAKVHNIGHEGHYFSVPGAHLVEPSPQRTPVLFQAGTSTAGREFAARNAELVFASDPRPEVLHANIDDVRRRAAAHGRTPDSIKFVTSIGVVVDSTDSAARAKADELSAYHDLEGGLVLLSALSGWTGRSTGWTGRSSTSTPTRAVRSWQRSMIQTFGGASPCVTTSAGWADSVVSSLSAPPSPSPMNWRLTLSAQAWTDSTSSTTPPPAALPTLLNT